MYKILLVRLMCVAICVLSFRGVTVYAGGTPQIPVLLYHHILSDNENTNFRNNPWTVSTENFEAQMKYLYDNGYKTLTLNDIHELIYEKKHFPEKSILITFDDGYYSNITRGYEILKKYGFNAVIFSITSKTEGSQQEFDPNALQFIAEKSMASTEDVFEYASHSHNLHYAKDEVSGLLLVGSDDIVSDLGRSFEIINNKTAFAYPLGQYNSAVKEVLHEVGIKLAFTTASGYINSYSDPYSLNRFIIYQSTPLSSFVGIVSNNAITENNEAKQLSVMEYQIFCNGKETSDFAFVSPEGNYYIPIKYAESSIIVDDGLKRIHVNK